MLLTSDDNPNSIIVMDTEVGATKAELTMRRQQKNWKLQVDSILPQQKFEQYKSTKEFSLYGLGDGGKNASDLHWNITVSGDDRPSATVPYPKFRPKYTFDADLGGGD